MTEQITGILNRRDLAERVASNQGVDVSLVADTVFAVFEEIARAVAAGGTISISNFGTFRPHTMAGHPGHNPATGESLLIPDITLLKFKASGHARDMVRTGDSNRSIRKMGNK